MFKIAREGPSSYFIYWELCALAELSDIENENRYMTLFKE